MIENLIRNFSFESGLSDWDDEGVAPVRITDDAYLGEHAMVLRPGSIVTQSYPIPVWATSDLLFFFTGLGMIELSVIYADGTASMHDVGTPLGEGFSPVWFPVRRTRPVSKIQLLIVEGLEVIVDAFLMLGWRPVPMAARYYGNPWGEAINRPAMASPRRVGGGDSDHFARFDEEAGTFMQAQMIEDRLIGIETKLNALLVRLNGSLDLNKKVRGKPSKKQKRPRKAARKRATS